MVLALLIMKDIGLWILLGAIGFIVVMLISIHIDKKYKDDQNTNHKWTKITFLSYKLYLVLLAYLLVFLEIHR
nr:MAG TPA: hypothetical protein [Caudoviricetes sp.]